ncbi:MAG TPA: GNAT family N-acetyltransferase [Gaiellaceae bacterium]|nr:GNAT family N-acetyltransferase [Gaiellaceae bacterium]
MIEVRMLDGEAAPGFAGELAAVLLDCVEGGASIGFMASLTLAEAREFYDVVCAEVAAGRRILLAAFAGGELVGSVQVVLAALPNGMHRGEIAKMLVRRSVRRQGVAAALIERAEGEALAAGKTLLVLDAVTDGDAARLYARLGWTSVGEVPGFALFPDGAPCSTTYFYKQLT